MAKIDGLFLTDAQLAGRIGIEIKTWNTIAPTLERLGLPKPDPLFQNRRYWPACKAFLDRRYNISPQSSLGSPALDGEERWK